MQQYNSRSIYINHFGGTRSPLSLQPTQQIWRHCLKTNTRLDVQPHGLTVSTAIRSTIGMEYSSTLPQSTESTMGTIQCGSFCIDMQQEITGLRILASGTNHNSYECPVHPADEVLQPIHLPTLESDPMYLTKTGDGQSHDLYDHHPRLAISDLVPHTHNDEQAAVDRHPKRTRVSSTRPTTVVDGEEQPLETHRVALKQAAAHSTATISQCGFYLYHF